MFPLDLIFGDIRTKEINIVVTLLIPEYSIQNDQIKIFQMNPQSAVALI